MAMIKETWVVDKPLAVVMWVSRLYGIVPLRFQSTRTTTVAYVSRPLYYLGVLFISLINLFGIADFIYYVPEAVAGPTADPKTSKNSNRLLAVVNILVTLTATLYCTISSIYKMKKYLQFTSEINKIKNSLNYSYTSGLKLRHAMCLLALWLFQLSTILFLGYWENGEFHQFISMIANIILYGSLGMMALHFVFVAFHINSSFEVINKCLLDVLSGISRESSIQNLNLRLLSRNEISFSYIKITSINKTIDLLGKVKQDVKMTPRMKLAREIHALSSSFVRTCEVLRDLNDTENITLLVHVVVLTTCLVITLNNLVLAVCCTTDVKYIIIVTIECTWFVCHTVRIVLIVEPCHRIQEELSQTKMLVARIMCEVIYETDPLYDATDNFFKQLHLNDVSISVMGIFSLGRSTISTFIGGATTLYVVLLEL